MDSKYNANTVELKNHMSIAQEDGDVAKYKYKV